MMSMLDTSCQLRDNNCTGLVRPNYGGRVDHFYVGSFTGGDDVLGGIIDHLLKDINLEDYAGGVEEIVNAEPISYHNIEDSGYAEPNEEIVVAGAYSSSLVVSRKQDIKLTKYSNVRKYIEDHVKTFDDKTFKGIK
jgi:hypothetical protein